MIALRDAVDTGPGDTYSAFGYDFPISAVNLLGTTAKMSILSLVYTEQRVHTEKDTAVVLAQE